MRLSWDVSEALETDANGGTLEPIMAVMMNDILVSFGVFIEGTREMFSV
jgi:hypothetical protein